jgi:hypothetical protein
MKHLCYQTVNYQGVNFVLAFTVDGVYVPATHYEPAEYPEVEICEVLANDLDIMPVLLEIQIEQLYDLLNECEI